MLLSTSFNVNREPIVETPEDTLICAFGTSIDYLVIEMRLVDCELYRRFELVTQMTKERNEKMVDEDEAHPESNAVISLDVFMLGRP